MVTNLGTFIWVRISRYWFKSQNVVVLLLSIELMLLALNLNWIGFSIAMDDSYGQLFALFVITVAAAESAIGLGLLVVYYRVRGTIAMDWVNVLKG